MYQKKPSKGSGAKCTRKKLRAQETVSQAHMLMPRRCTQTSFKKKKVENTREPAISQGVRA